MDISSDEVLNSWLRLTTAIGNLRITSALPYNELLICGLLYRNQKSGEVSDEPHAEQHGKEGADFPDTVRAGPPPGIRFL